MKKAILLMVLLYLPIVFGANSHEFIINKYLIDVKTDSYPILLKPLISEAFVSSCSSGNYSFILKNPSLFEHTYAIEVSDFKGLAYHVQQISLKSKDSRQINLKLEPDCALLGILNPKVTVSTGTDKQMLSMIMHITGFSKSDCGYYFNETICSSPYYIKMMQGSSRQIDLKEYFYDPDMDKLTFSVDTSNIKVDLKGSIATLKPRWDYTGAETIIFKADDSKGGIARSRMFYVHVYSNAKSYLQNFMYSNAVLILVGFIIFLIFLLILISLLKS